MDFWEERSWDEVREEVLAAKRVLSLSRWRARFSRYSLRAGQRSFVPENTLRMVGRFLAQFSEASFMACGWKRRSMVFEVGGRGKERRFDAKVCERSLLGCLLEELSVIVAQLPDAGFDGLRHESRTVLWPGGPPLPWPKPMLRPRPTLLPLGPLRPCPKPLTQLMNGVAELPILTAERRFVCAEGWCGRQLCDISEISGTFDSRVFFEVPLELCDSLC